MAGRSLAYTFWEGAEIVAPRVEQTVDIVHRNTIARIVFAEALIDHRFNDHVRNADAGRARAGEKYLLICELLVLDLQGGREASDRYARRPWISSL